eukprot:600997-Rhodomonas_salina.5
MCLCACYALSSTDLAYAAPLLCSCYALPGTDLAHMAVQTQRRGPIAALHHRPSTTHLRARRRVI